MADYLTMMRGCTPEHSFSVPLEEDYIAALWLTFSQDGEVVLEKQKQDCIFDGLTAKVQLSQEDTLKFDEGITIEIQMRLRDIEGRAYKTEIVKAKPTRLLHEGVI